MNVATPGQAPALLPLINVDVRQLTVAIFGVGLALTTASQLRFGGLVGTGELLLVMGTGMAWLYCLYTQRVAVGRPALVVVVPFLLVVLGMLLGWLLGLSTGSWNAAAGPRDAAAYCFSAVVLSGFFLLPDPRANVRLAVAVMATVTGLGLGGILLLSFVARGLISPIVEPWYGIRFVGWAINPNQIAFIVGTVPFIAYHFYRRAEGRLHKGVALAVMASSAAAGLATLSDSLLLGWMAAGTVLAAMKLLTADPAGLLSRRVLLRVSLALAAVLVGLALSITLIIAAVNSLILDEQGQGITRVILWLNGIGAFLESPLVGHGPGAYSWHETPAALTEAHNTFIDLATSAGLVGLVPIVVLFGAATARAIRRRDAGLLGCMTYVVVFCTFHFLLRHPLLWFLLAFVYMAAEAPPRPAVPSSREA